MDELIPLTVEMNDFFEQCREFAAQWNGDCIGVIVWKNGSHRTRLLWECSNGHTWPADWGNIKGHGSWCPTCKTSSGQGYTKAVFETLLDREFKDNYRPDFLRYARNLELDGFNEELKLAFEYQGIQHEEHVEFFRDEKGFIEQQQRDEFKAQRCAEEGIVLITVSYKEFKLGPENLYRFIKGELERFGFDQYFAAELPSNIRESLTRRVARHSSIQKANYYENLRQVVEIKKGFTLIDKCWLGRRFKYSLICQNGHRFKMLGDDLLRKDQDRGCLQCVKTLVTENRVKDMVEAAGCTLVRLALEHRSNKTRKVVHMLCPVGHAWVEEWDNFNRECDEYGDWRVCKKCFPTVKGRRSPLKLIVMQRETALKLFSELARREGGRVVQPFIFRGRKGTREEVGISFICAQGHVFKLSPFEIIYVREWCPNCKDSGKKEEQSIRESPPSANEEVIYIDDWDD